MNIQFGHENVGPHQYSPYTNKISKWSLKLKNV